MNVTSNNFISSDKVPTQYHKHPSFYTIDELIKAKKDLDFRSKRIGTKTEEPEDREVVRIINQALEINRELASRFLKLMRNSLEKDNS